MPPCIFIGYKFLNYFQINICKHISARLCASACAHDKDVF